MSAERHIGYEPSQELYIGNTMEEYFNAQDYSGKSLIIVPGTSDPDGSTLCKWASVLVDRFAIEDRSIVDYPASVGPIVAGRGAEATVRERWHAHRYNESKIIAVMRALAKLEQTKEQPRQAGSAMKVVLFGYSQGADGVWEAARLGVEMGIVSPDEIEVILWAHPGMPGGIKDVVSSSRIRNQLVARAFGADMSQLWVPHPDITTTSITMQGDAITSFPAVWPNPMRFARQFNDGFFGIHSGLGARGADKLAELKVIDQAYRDRTRHLVLDTAA